MADPAGPIAAAPFHVERIEVTGNSVLSSSQLSPAVTPYQGHDVTLEQLNAAADGITKIYHDRGYFLAKAYVTAQSVQGGVATIQVLEGRVGKVKIQGNQFYSTDFLRSRFNTLVAGKVIRYDTLEKAIQVLDENSDIDAKVKLEPGEETGYTDVVLTVHDSRPSHLVADYNNYGNAFVGQNRLGIGFFDGNLSGHGDQFLIKTLYAFPATSSFPLTQGLYSFPITSGGARLAISAATGQFLVGDQLQALNVQSQSNIEGITYTNPLTRAINSSTNLSLAFYAKSFNNTILNTQTSNDQIRDLVVGYDGSWFHTGSNTSASFRVTEGLGTLFGGTPNGAVNVSRFGAGDSFTKFNADGVHIIKTSDKSYLLLKGTLQLTGTPLLIGEQFSLGGSDTVRGFQQSAVLTDSGFALSAEEHFSLTKTPSSTEGVVFVDSGSGYLQHPLVNELGTQSMTGAGLGFRTTLGKETAIKVDVGFPLSSTTIIKQGTNPVVYGAVSTRY